MAAARAPEQLVFDLPFREARGAEDFIVTPANADVVALVDRWPDWPAPFVLVNGPSGVGKSHLVAVWRSRSGAERIAARDLSPDVVERFKTANGTRAIAIEDIDAGGFDDWLLFNILNLAREQGGTVLMTARRPAADIDVTVADLRSRLRATPSFALSEPDDTLLAGLLVKLFMDRQLDVEPNVINYLVRRMERSAAAASEIVGALDTAALAGRRRVTRALAAAVLSRLEAGG